MSPHAWVGVVTGGLLLLIGIVAAAGPAWRAGAGWRRARKRLGRDEDPFAGGPPELREGWSRYTALVERERAVDGQRRMVVAEQVLTPGGVTGALDPAAGAGIGLLWAAWGGAMAVGVLAGSGGAAAAAAYATGGVAAGAGWLGITLLLIRRARAESSHFFAALRERDSTVAPGEFAAEVERRSASSGRRIGDVAARQVELLQEHTTTLREVAPAVGEEVRAVLEGSLLPTLRAMVDTLDRLSGTVEERQREALEVMAASFKAQLMSGFREEFEDLARALSEAADWHQQVHRDLGKLLASADRLGEGHIAMLRRTLRVTEVVRGNADSLARAERSLALTADRVQAAATRITDTLESTTDSVVTRLQTATQEMSEQLGQLTTTLNGQMTETTEQLGRRIQNITMTLQRLAGELEMLGREQQRTRPGGGTFPRGF